MLHLFILLLKEQYTPKKEKHPLASCQDGKSGKVSQFKNQLRGKTAWQYSPKQLEMMGTCFETWNKMTEMKHNTAPCSLSVRNPSPWKPQEPLVDWKRCYLHPRNAPASDGMCANTFSSAATIKGGLKVWILQQSFAVKLQKWAVDFLTLTFHPNVGEQITEWLNFHFRVNCSFSPSSNRIWPH